MKQISISAFGVPEDVARCVDVSDVGPPLADEVVFDVLAFPINPADIGFCYGHYGPPTPLPATPGAECVGRITAVGPGVPHLKCGDLVTNLQRANWTQRRRVPAADIIPLPPGIDLRQAAMIRINPPTALLLLSDFVNLRPGDWIVQNVANSAVGRCVIALARRAGVRTLNIVRRDSLVAELGMLGADVTLLDGEDLPVRAAAAVQGAPIRLGLDAVSGTATARLAACLVDDGTVVTYGVMSGDDPHIDRSQFFNRGIKLTGFILGRHLARRDRAAVRDIYAHIARLIIAHELQAPVERIYPIEEIQEALAHARRGGRGGKILVTPNGPL